MVGAKVRMKRKRPAIAYFMHHIDSTVSLGVQGKPVLEEYKLSLSGRINMLPHYLPSEWKTVCVEQKKPFE